MPLLSELREFKASLAKIGGQKANLEAKKIPINDLKLPDTEAEPMVEPEPMAEPEPAAAPAEPEVGDGGIGDFDFSDLLGAQPGELSVPDITEPADIAEPAPPPADDKAGADDTYFPPDELLSDLPDKLEPVPPTNSLEGDSVSGLENLDNLENFNFPTDSAEPADLASPPGSPDPAAKADALSPEEADGALDLSVFDDLGDFGDLGLPKEPAAAEGGETPDLGDIDLPAEPAEEQATAEAGDTPPDLDDLGDLDLPAEPAVTETGDTPNLDDLGDLDLPAEPVAEPAAAEAGDTPDLDDLGDLDLPSEPAAEPAAAEASDTSEPAQAVDEEPQTGIDLGDLDGQVSADGLVESADKDAFEGFDPLSGVGQDKAPGETAADNIDTLDDIDESSFPDLDNILGESAKDKKAPVGKAARKRDKRKDEIPIPEDEKDIELNDNELRYLQETLAEYPLNLRIACEEIIAEQDVRPEQMVRLIRNLIRGAPARETAQLASEILERPITIPKGFEKSSVEALEAEKGTFAYIFIHNFLPVLRLVALLAIIGASIFYLSYKFIYIPLKAESIYKMGYALIPKGEYQRSNERFSEAFSIHRKKDWFYKYADAFTKERQYVYAEQKYDELLRYYPRDKLGVLSYAQLETKHLRNYAKADSLLRHQILDYNPDDPDALLALGDNSLEWGETDPSKYEDARFSYARLLDLYGQQPFIMERMLKYFIRTDNLKEVLPIWAWFDAVPKKRPLEAETLSELGGYLLDKQLEEVRGVPNEYVALIEDVRKILLRAVQQDSSLPEPHYHLARYYKNLGNAHEERVTLEIALDRFEKAEEGSLRRITNHIDAYQRYADNLIDSREFLHAEEQLQKGLNLYDDAIKRRLLSPSPQYGRLYAGLGDLEYFVKTGDMEAALRYYNLAQQNGWAPPDMQYRMGAAHYQLGDWRNALENFFTASSKLPQNRRILFALGNSALKRGDYFAAQGYYNRLLTILENHRSRLPLLLPNDRPEYLDLAERLMMARNNAGVTNEMLAARTGSRAYHSRAMSLYSESQRAWDSLTRDPSSMVRSASTSLPYLNMRNVLYPRQNYEPQMFMRIDREASESSRWEQLAPAFKD